MKRYAKFAVAALAGILAVLDELYGPGSVASQVVIAIAGAFGVLQARNEA